MRLLSLKAILAGLMLAALLHAPAMAARHALVIGEGRYQSAGVAEFSVSDAKSVAAALTASGWQVQTVYDQDAQGLVASIQAFAGGLSEGDAVLVYFSGHSAKGPATVKTEGVENYLLPIDANPMSMDALPSSSIPLSSLLAVFAPSKPSAQVVILDSARPNQVEGRWSASPGLAEPTTSALTNAYVILPAQPGRIAREGKFAPELVRVLAKPGLSAGQAFADVSDALDRSTGGSQTPWISGSSKSAAAALTPGVAQTGGDEQRFREAVACGTPVCLAAAADAVSDRHLKIDLMLRSQVATVEDLPPLTAASTPAPAAPPMDYVQAFVDANRDSPAGQGRIGKNYLRGEGGFPKSPAQAYTWLIRGASAGDRDANYLIALFFDQGLPPVGHVDRYAAVKYFQEAARQGEPNAQYQLGVYYYHGYAGLPADAARGAELMAKAAAAGQADAKEVLAGRKAP